jgi:hypothetical protein
MNDFTCKCIKCGTEKSYTGMKDAYMDGWIFGRIQTCYDCDKNKKTDKLENTIVIPDETN